ncbi:CatB-related O-acetyltransferase [uncultured Paracoccus sp.]|jgi:acetyltransferase-like isoleucine patch superfamily enzyme|uniref:CatB-related O-acetyltransferase n=1 Tax=Paracoccus sp. TaxID=267 RepID=UPI0026022930|nr:CatB-related O-acetyltransferase [uncultured Paracoccus sp.]|tara:strand:- start:22604 stop:23350 length:747 start_codon:yes stop_codon:yes gene_type:complete
MKLSFKAAKLLDDCRIEPFDGPTRRRFRAMADLQVARNLQCEAFSRHPPGFLMSLGAFSYVSGATRDMLKLRAGRFCSIARGVNVVSGNHPVAAVSTSPFFYGHYHARHLPEVVNAVGKPDFTRDLGGVRVGDDVWIGGYCVLKGGIRIGTGAVVAAGSVVVRDVDPYTIVGGNPARVIRPRFDPEQAARLLDSAWWQVDPKCLRGLDMTDIDAFCDGLAALRARGEAADLTPARVTLAGDEIVLQPD